MSQEALRGVAERAEPSVASICEALLALESELELFSWRLEGVAPWPLMRMPLYYALTKSLGVFGAPHGSSRWRGRLWRGGRLWLYAACAYLTRPQAPTELLIFDHPRKVWRGERAVDLYSEALIEALKRRGVPIEVYENLSYLNDELSPRDHPRRYHDLISTLAQLGARLSLKLSPPQLSETDEALLESLERGLEERLGAQISLRPMALRLTREFRIRRARYRKLLRRHRPKGLVVVIAYAHSMAPLIAAARELGIPSFELQHGTFSAYHLGYHFPQLKAHPYFCDHLLSFGDFWADMAQLPLPPESIKSLGFRHMSEQLKVPQRPLEERDEVLFLSQGVIGEGLSRYALVCAERELPWRLIYKLHPSEYGTWRAELPALARAADAGALEVIDHGETPLYELMGRARYQVGVFSTALYEGLALGCQTLLAALPGLEYMRPLIDQGCAELVSSPRALVERLRGGQVSSTAMSAPPEVFAPPREESVDWLLARLKGREP